MARVLDRANMQRAWKRVKANRGAPGMDGMRIEDFSAFACSHWPGIRQQLADGNYRPQPVRRVSIPKPGGGERLLAIPTVMDRVIQQAIAQVLTPTFDPHSARRKADRCRRCSPTSCCTTLILDRKLERRGHWFVRYADDLLVLVKTASAGQRVRASVTALRSKSYWHLSKTQATQSGMTNE